MFDAKMPADICDELSAMFREAAARGVTLDDVSALVAAAEYAGRKSHG